MKKPRINFVLAAAMLLCIAFAVTPKASAATSFTPSWPLDHGSIVGSLDAFFNGGSHNGMDINPDGSAYFTQNVYAVASGTVVETRNKCCHEHQGANHACPDTWGNYICIKHVVDGKTYYSVYAQLKYNSISVSVGASVAEGEMIAQMGSSGGSTGYHLHLEIWQGSRSDRNDGRNAATFDYYKDNPQVLQGKRFRSGLVTHSKKYKNWIKENCVNEGDYYRYNGQYTVSFSDTGDAYMDSITINAGDSLTIPDLVPHSFGLNFWGWKCDNILYQPGDTFTPTGDMTLSGEWLIWKDVISGGVSCSTDIRYPGYGKYYNFQVDESGRYVFEGINDANLDTCASLYDSTGALILSNDDGGSNMQFKMTYNLETNTDYVLFVEPCSADATGTMLWEIVLEKHTVFFMDGDSEIMDSITVKAGESLQIPNTVPHKFGQNFTGWYYDDWTWYAPGASFWPNEDMILYGGWNTWIITAEDESCYGSTPCYPEFGFYTHVISDQGGKFTFEGVSTAERGTKACLYDSAGNLLVSDDNSAGNGQFKLSYYLVANTDYVLQVLPDSTGSTEQLEFKVYPSRYTIKFDGNGGMPVPDDILLETNETAVLPTVVPEKDWENFIGWQCGEKMYQPGDVYPYAEDGTMVAQWSAWDINWTADMTRQTYDHTVTYPGVGVKIKLVIEKAGKYQFRGLNGQELDTEIYLYDANGVPLANDDNGAGNKQFLLQQKLEAGTYYLEIKPKNAADTGAMRWEIGMISGVSGAFSWEITGMTLVITGNGKLELSFAAWSVYSEMINAVVIEGGVTVIGENVFSGYLALSSVTIPDSITGIDVTAFAGCASLQYTVYDNANYLGNANNPHLALIKVTAATVTACQIHPDTKMISVEAFSGCASLQEINVPEGVVSIGASAFSGCTKLEKVTLPKSVKQIGSQAFLDAAVTAVHYAGSEAEWKNITIDQLNESLLAATHTFTNPGATTEPEVTQPTESQPEETQQVTTEAATTEPEEDDEDTKEAEEKKSSKVIWIVAAAVVVLGAAGAGAFLFLRRYFQ